MLKQSCPFLGAFLATFLAATLMTSLPAVAARNGQSQQATAVGQVVRSMSASLGGIAVPSGGTVVSGDTMSTAKGGGALVQFAAGSQIELGEDSSVTFGGAPGHVLVKFDHGTVTVGAAGPGTVVVETAQCRVEPAGQGSVSYMVTAPMVAGPTVTAPTVTGPAGAGASITAQHGALGVTEIASGQSHPLAEGETWTCPNAPAAAQTREEGRPGAGEQAGQAPAPQPAKHSNTGLLVLLLGGGAAAGIGAAVAAGGKGGGGGGPASPSAP
jgi:hypothetical protein